MHRAHASQCSRGWRPGPAEPPVEAMGPALPPGFGSSRYEPTDSSNPGEVNRETGAGGWENGYIGEGQAAYRKCTAHTRHRTRARAQVPVGLPWSCRFLQLRDACLTDPIGGVGL